ncbi:hypothetical protein [Rathayibacter sp. VKM Ac-2801]|uniref:hypothetical protein n=1 Tax=Rathayibacter sp. VKM Ac-2801 TaxID=2609255 RepID=UPI00131FEA08|nr:hypothetical protein [Rathayibacter sp. VKM Ac-2801]QHC71029.1 hypothetical protein GSU45_12045 [Rathayibacter sp. VKM Ac-2801]
MLGAATTDDLIRVLGDIADHDLFDYVALVIPSVAAIASVIVAWAAWRTSAQATSIAKSSELARVKAEDERRLREDRQLEAVKHEREDEKLTAEVEQLVLAMNAWIVAMTTWADRGGPDWPNSKLEAMALKRGQDSVVMHDPRPSLSEIVRCFPSVRLASTHRHRIVVEPLLRTIQIVAGSPEWGHAAGAMTDLAERATGWRNGKYSDDEVLGGVSTMLAGYNDVFSRHSGSTAY